MEKPFTTDNYSTVIARVMEIEDITWGNPKEDFVVRFRGQLSYDQIEVHSLLRKEFQDDGISPIIRFEDGRHTIYLIEDQYTSVVESVFNIHEMAWGNEQDGFVIRYWGELTRNSIEAYDFLAKSLDSYELTPLFREEEGKQSIILVSGINRPTKSNPWVNALMFALTLFSVALVGAMNSYEGPAETFTEYLFGSVATLWKGWPFAVSLLAILLAHEFGHYLAGRYHKTAVTLPYFIPFPLPPFGTLGAFIQLKEPPKNKRILHDIGVAGPLAGLVVAIPVLLIGLMLSNLDTLPQVIPNGGGFTLEGNSILYLLSKFIVFGEFLPAPPNYNDINPILYWLRFFFTGRPIPLGGKDVLLHPVALAGWGGLLVTALNLIPAGQLDGGHLIYVLLGKRARRLLPFILVGLVGLGLIWQGWWLWALIIFFLGRAYAEPLDQITSLDYRRRAIAILGLIIFFLVFTPVPLQLIAGPSF